MQDDQAVDVHEKMKKVTELDMAERQAQVRKINAEALLLEGQAAHQQAEALQVLASVEVQKVNVKIAGAQLAMQLNTIRLQTAQVDAEIANPTPKSRSN